MIGLLQGTPHDHGKQSVLIQTETGVGYAVYVSLKTKNDILKKKTCTLYVHTGVSRDVIQLFGFLDQKEYSVFNLLLQVNGIGPKKALDILDNVPANTILDAIAQEDTDTLISFGINKKMAFKIILDLGKKIDTSLDSNVGDVIAALIGLGYNKKEIAMVIKKIDTSQTVEKQIQESLKFMRQS